MEHDILRSQSDGEGEGHSDDNVPFDKSGCAVLCCVVLCCVVLCCAITIVLYFVVLYVQRESLSMRGTFCEGPMEG